MSLVLFNTHDMILIGAMFLCILNCLQIENIKSRHPFFKWCVFGFFLSSAAIPFDTLINFGANFHDWVVTNIPHIIYAFEFGAWLQAPFGFLLVSCLIDRDFRFKSVYWLLFLPFGLHALHQVTLYHSLAEEIKVSIQESHNIFNLSSSIFFVQLARELFRFVLAILSLSLLLKYRTCSSPRPPWGWLDVLCMYLIAYTGLGVLISSLLLIQTTMDIHIPVGFFGLLQNYCSFILLVILLIEFNRDALKHREYVPIIMHKKNESHAQVNLEYVKKVESLMELKKCYINSSLSLDSLAKEMNISARTLSSVINGYYGYNFGEFINRYRLDEAKRLLVEERNSTVLDIMYAAGFNSKAAFNGAFKRSEGITPSEFRKRIDCKLAARV